jgi:hypothetical protein
MERLERLKKSIMNSTFFELASLLSRVNHTEQEALQCKVLVETNLIDKQNQQAFYDYCREWKLAPWIWIQLNRLELHDHLDNEITQHFLEQYTNVKNQNDQRNEVAKQFLKRFSEENIDVIILKGNCLAHEVYHEIGYKRMNDFDILIHKNDWDRIQSIYLELGFIPLGFGWSGEKEKPAKFSHVGMSFISPDFKCIVGSQWGLKSPTTQYKDFIHEAWESAVEFNFLGIQCKQLSPEFHLLHLILHLGIYKCGIRDCMDLYNLLRVKEINSSILLPLLEKSNAVEKAFFSLEIMQLSSPNLAQDILNGLRPKRTSFLMKRLERRLKLQAITGDYQTAYNDYFQDIEKQVIYFNLFTKFHIKFLFYLKVIRLIYFPAKKYVLKLNDLTENAPWYSVVFRRLTTPGRIFSLIAQEIGWKFTILLFLKLGIDLLVSLKNYFIKKPSYFDYLKTKNIDPKEIEKVVKNIQ